MGYNPQESLENTINTMPTRTLGVYPSPAGFGQILHPVTKLNSPRILCRGELHSRRHISRRTFSYRKGILSKCNDLVHMRCFLWFPDVFTFNRLNNVFKLIHQYYISPALTYLQLNVRKNDESYNQPTNKPTNQPIQPNFGYRRSFDVDLIFGKGGIPFRFSLPFPARHLLVVHTHGSDSALRSAAILKHGAERWPKETSAVRFQPAISNSDWIPRNVHIPPREK